MTSTQLCILPPVFLSSNVLVLAWTNGVEDAPYDLFMTTNLAPGATFLNLTNWAWLYRSAPGQTNFTLTNYPVPEAYFALGTTNDTDADGLTDAFELLVSHSLPGTNDSDGDGLLDGWMWQHFGHALASASDNTRAQDDYDSDGVSNLDEFNAGTDPNTVRFTAHVGYGHVNTTAPTATIEVLKGVPSELAVLVDDENRAGAQWQAFAASPPLSLPASDGAHRVWLGLRGRTESGAVWLGFTVTLDRQPPAVFLTSPETAATSKPYLQLRGYSPEDLRGVSCTLSNAAGVQTNLLGVITGASGPTNRFQCFDVALTNGANALALSVTDLAGNVTSTNLSVTLDYSGDTNAPAWAVHWPRHGERIGANTFTLRGWVDDETASVTAVITSASTTNTAGGTVERNGAVWVDNLPLAAGTNWVTLTARDAAGNLSTTNLAVVKSSVTLTMETPAPSALTQPRVTVSGSISASGYRVWVNGVAADPVGGNWSASNVPVTPGGSAVFALTAIPLTANGGNGTPPAGSGSDPANLNPTSADAVNVAGQPEKDPEVKLVTGEWEAHDLELGLIGSAYYAWDYAWHYSETNGGYAERTHTEPMGAGEVMSGSRCWVDTNGTLRFEHWVESPTNTTSTNEMLLTDMMWGGFRVDRPWAKGEWQHGYVEGWGYYETGDIAKNTRVVLRTGGRAGLPRKNLFMVSATPRERTATGWRDIEPTQVLIPALGKNLGSDHRAFGTLPDNEEVLLSPEAKAAYYNFDSLGVGKLRLDLSQVTFSATNGGCRSVLNDTNGGPYSWAHWWTNSATSTGQEAPVLFVAGARPEATLGFGVASVGMPALQFVAKGEATVGGAKLTFWGTNSLGSAATSWSVGAVADGVFASQVDFVNPLTVEWSYRLTNTAAFIPAGRSENPVYVCLGPPITSNLYHTVVHLACGNPGATTADEALTNTWAMFSTGSGPANVTTWDGRTLYYYKPNISWPSATTTTAGLLETQNGNCYAWMSLLKDAVGINGAILTNTQVTAADGLLFLVKDWGFQEPPSVPSAPEFKWMFNTKVDGDIFNLNPTMVPAPYSGGNVYYDLTNLTTVPGQNTSPPSEKFFVRHWILRHSSGVC